MQIKDGYGKSNIKRILMYSVKWRMLQNPLQESADSHTRKLNIVRISFLSFLSLQDPTAADSHTRKLNIVTI